MSTLLKSLLSTFGKNKAKSQPKIEKPKPVKSVPVPKVVAAPSREAESTAREIIDFARDEAEKIRETARLEMQGLSASLKDLQSKLAKQEEELVKRGEGITAREKYLQDQGDAINKLRQEIEELKKKTVEKLEKVSGLSRDKAKEILLEALDKKLVKEVADRLRAAEDKFKEEAEEKGREILIDAMYHGATDYVAEYTISTVKLSDDDAKGRIIGKDGRNIRTFEKVTGVDIDMDETPGEIRLSSYDSVRREIARVALERLIKDGRIQPTRIEEYVGKARRDVEKVMFEEGKRLCHAVGAYNVPVELIAMLGRFKYRSSYGQNMLAHTLEETKMGMKLASETGANIDIVRMGCLFHDIGKIVTDEEGSHIELGVKLLKKYNVDERVVACVAEHHEDQEFSSQESVLVYIADAVSGARPGARYENYDEYIKRLKSIEEIAMSKKGVAEAFAIQAGREVRVIVNPLEATDDEAVKMASDIRDEIKAKVTYPGTVTVTVIRETRTTEVAK